MLSPDAGPEFHGGGRSKLPFRGTTITTRCNGFFRARSDRGEFAHSMRRGGRPGAPRVSAGAACRALRVMARLAPHGAPQVRGRDILRSRIRARESHRGRITSEHTLRDPQVEASGCWDYSGLRPPGSGRFAITLAPGEASRATRAGARSIRGRRRFARAYIQRSSSRTRLWLAARRCALRAPFARFRDTLCLLAAFWRLVGRGGGLRPPSLARPRQMATNCHTSHVSSRPSSPGRPPRRLCAARRRLASRCFRAAT